MIDGRGKMLDSVNKELEHLEKMRRAVNETIVTQTKLIAMNQTKLHEASALMDRFEQQTEMCYRLKDSLGAFQAGLDALSDSKEK